MRDILLILGMLLLGVFSAKAFGIHIPTSGDVVIADPDQIEICIK